MKGLASDSFSSNITGNSQVTPDLEGGEISINRGLIVKNEPNRPETVVCRVWYDVCSFEIICLGVVPVQHWMYT